MIAAIENHIREVDAYYRPLILQQSARFIGSERLMSDFDHAVKAFRKYGRRQVSGLIERVNELAVARHLLLEPDFATSRIEYEPQIVEGPKFDFVIAKPGGPPYYIEVKTVRPQISINETSWRKAKYEPRQIVIDMTVTNIEPPNRHLFLQAIHAAFLRNAVETELKLASHALIEPGSSTLIFCSDGQTWGRPELEDFAKVYVGKRVHFGAMIRPQDALLPTYLNSDLSSKPHIS